MDEQKKVYTVKEAFELDGLSYDAGVQYELAPSAVATLPVGTVEEFVEVAQVTSDAPATETPAVETKPAKPWVGGHTVGRE